VNQPLALRIFLLLLLGLGITAVSPTPTAHAQTITAAELATAVAQAQPGDTLTVQGGAFTGNLVIDKPLTLNGVDWPVVDGDNTGSIITIAAPDTTIRGFVIRNSGQSLDQQNSGIVIEGEHALVENNRFENTLFGIYAKEGHHATIRQNQITSKDLDVQLRGDPIRIWYSNDVTLADNTITSGRDVVLWYAEHITIENNRVNNGRYGLHFMYCDDATITNNLLTNNSVGIFMMYSRRAHIDSNTIAHNRGPSGFGIGLKDMDDAIITNNLLLDNRVGVHLDTSPREVDSIGQFSGNVLAYNDIGVQMMPSIRHNHFTNNSFVENSEQVAVAGGGILKENLWTVEGRGNYWSDYAGYDATADGQGDIPYKSERLFEQLMNEKPELRLFLHSPAANAIDFAAKAVPLVRPQPKLEDTEPLMAPQIPANVPALPQSAPLEGIWSGLLLIALAASIAWLPKWRRASVIGNR
jgi:nitrous oxidase accessory protein